MAEVAAFGVAVNILTVVDYGRQFVAVAWKIHKSGQDGLSGITSLQVISEDLLAVTHKLQEAGAGSVSQGNEVDDQLLILTHRCHEVAQQIRRMLKDLEIPERDHGGPVRFLSSLFSQREAILKATVAAFKFKWMESDIKGLEDELEGLRSEIIMNLAVSCRTSMIKTLDNQGIMLRHLAQSQKSDEKMRRRLDDIVSRQEGLGSKVLDIITSSIASSQPNSQNSLRDSLIKAVYNCAHQPGTQDAVAAKFKISTEHRAILEEKFVSRLRYNSMDQREQTVVKAHESTFRWIFEHPESRACASNGISQDEDSTNYIWDDFGAWLQSDQSLYWITGKAGSGKSTLMKYVSMELPPGPGDIRPNTQAQSRCSKYLHQWAKGQPLVIVTFYFWAGAKDQKQTSRDGLFRTLLTQILEACPEAIPDAAAERWETLCLFNVDTRPLTTADLEGMLTRAVGYVSRKMKLCFFIDGLDEFNGDTRDLSVLIQWMRRLLDTGPIKLCVASRPWTVFEDALDGKPNLLMESLTADDIKAVISSKFDANSEFKFLEQREPDFAGQLKKEIARKASGVFLWVNLVCDSLIAGIMAGDRIVDLRKRLDELPPDLATLFDRILDNLDPKYTEHAAQYFFLMRASLRAPHALLFSFADDSDEDPESPFKMQAGLKDGAEIQYRIKEMRKRLNSRCKGLIYISKLSTSLNTASIHENLRTTTVQYLHRTVRDYMERNDTQEKITRMLKSPFDPYARLCSASFAMWKTHADWLPVRVGNVLESHQQLFDCLRFAASVAEENTMLMIRLMEELKGLMRTGDDKIVFAKIGDLGPGSHAFLPLLDRSCFGNTFLSLAIKFDVIPYVKRKVEQGCIIASRQPFAPLRLCHHTPESGSQVSWRSFFKRQRPGPTKNSIASKEPNTIREQDFIPWPLLLDALFSNDSPNPAMVDLLLSKGADPNLATGEGDFQSTIWTEVLAYTVARGLTEVSSASSGSDAWADILHLMVRYGASIETRTIARALRVVTDAYQISPSLHGVTVIGLQNRFRASRFSMDRAGSSQRLESARPMERASGTVSKHPYSHMQMKRQMRRVR